MQINSIKKFKVNNEIIHLQGDLTILQACEKVGLWIPRFCYSESLSIAGNCRMCLVEIEKSPKLMPACAIKIGENMKIYTKTNLVKKVRESILEFLLINHPLDCPICDQGGECDLQDQAMFYGSDRGRFYDYKRSVQDKNGGPLIKTIMTRCIHCTRCIRFATEIAGVESLGTSGRGKGMQVGTYISNLFSSELSGNVIDLCPVGALTSKPYAFSFRPWELKSIESVDVLDGMGSNIRIDTKSSELMRILPRTNDLVNEQWISDKTRFALDGLKYQRLVYPMFRTELKKWAALSWKNALAITKGHFLLNASEKISCHIGPFVDLETIQSLKKFANLLGIPENTPNIGSNHKNHIGYTFKNIDYPCEFLSAQNGSARTMDAAGARTKFSDLAKMSINSSRQERFTAEPQKDWALDRKSTTVLIAGCNPRYEASLLNLRLRQKVLQASLDKPVNIYTIATGIGQSLDLTYPKKHLGCGIQTLFSLIQGKQDCTLSNINQFLPRKGLDIKIFLGFSILKRLDSNSIIQSLTHWMEDLSQNQTPWSKNPFKPKYHLSFVTSQRLVKRSVVATKKVSGTLWTRVGAYGSSFAGGIDFVHPYASSAGASLLGFASKASQIQDAKAANLNYIVGISKEDVDWEPKLKKNDSVSIYQGHHGSGLLTPNIILPSTAYVEKKVHYANLQGYVQQTQKAISAIGHSDTQARDDWKIICALASLSKYSGPNKKSLNTKLGLAAKLKKISENNTKLTLPTHWQFYKILSHFSKTASSHWQMSTLSLPTEPHFSLNWAGLAFDSSDSSVWQNVHVNGNKISQGYSRTWKTNWIPLYDNFYLTDVISKSSITMGKCSREFVKKVKFGTPVFKNEQESCK